MKELRALTLVLGMIGCGADAREGDRTAPPVSTSGRDAEPSETGAPTDPGQGRSVIGERVCLPVAACNMFTSCALAQAETLPSGATRYRVLAYDHHPHRVGALWQRENVCWPEQAGGAAKGCTDALLYSEVPCTATPSAPMALGYSCAFVDQTCVAVAPQATAPSADTPQLTRDAIEGVAKALRATARTKCWEPLATKKGPDTARVTVRVTIEPDGTPGQVNASGAPAYPTLSGCVISVVEASSFPEHDRPTAITLPFTFSR